MKRRFIITILLLLSFTKAQVTPYDPPAGAELTIISPHRVILSDAGQAALSLLIRDGKASHTHAWDIWQFPIELPGISTYRVTIESFGLPPDSKIYLRYDNPDNYVGPFYGSDFEDGIERSIGNIHSKIIVVELDLPAGTEDSFRLILKSVHALKQEAVTDRTSNEIPPKYHNLKDRELPVILVTGYWPPTNEMIRHFSQNEELNPEGWQGEDWEGRGYDVVSYFPQFANPDCSDCGQGYGDLEVDYQDTSEDFWPITENHTPAAIITFSRGWTDNSWEVEYNYFNRTNWIGDYSTPVMPTPNPPDQNEDAYFHRYSNLPMENIVSAVDALNIGLTPYIDWSGDPGHFVSEFMGYHGVWYRDQNAYGEAPCITAGHVHVGGQVMVETARAAAEETIRQIMDYLDLFAYTPGDINQDDSINIQDLVLAVNVILGTTELTQAQFYAADVNTDSIINIQDIIIILNMIINGVPG